MVERQYEAIRRDRQKGSEENRSDGPASSESTPNSTPTPTPASLNDETQPDVIIFKIQLRFLHIKHCNRIFTPFSYSGFRQ